MFLARTLLFLCLSVMALLNANAELLHIPISQQGNQAINMPVHGDTQSQVIQRFGEPNVRHPSVGQPPISRWDYPNFSVYFEQTTVISSVHIHTPRNSVKP